MNKENLFDFDLDITNVKSPLVTAKSSSVQNTCRGDCSEDCTAYTCPYGSIGVEPCYTDDTCGANRCRI